LNFTLPEQVFGASAVCCFVARLWDMDNIQQTVLCRGLQ